MPDATFESSYKNTDTKQRKKTKNNSKCEDEEQDIFVFKFYPFPQTVMIPKERKACILTHTLKYTRHPHWLCLLVEGSRCCCRRLRDKGAQIFFFFSSLN